MNSIINKILVPIDFNEDYLSIAVQAAEIAQKHQAELYLLHIVEPNISNYISQVFNYKKANSLYSISKNKLGLIQTWQRWLEKEYGIKVNFSVEFGNWKKLVINKAQDIDASLVTLKKQTEKNWKRDYISSASEYVVNKSPCQVITFTSNASTISDWKNIVIPITNFIPALRVKTIIEIVKSHNVKLHLIAFSNNSIVSHKSNFYYLTETLKMLKASGNIQVECKCIKASQTEVKAIDKYAKSVEADAIFTNKKLNSIDSQQSKHKLQLYLKTEDKASEQNLIPA